MKSPAISAGLRAQHACRSEAEKEAIRLKQSDAAVARLWIANHHGNPLGNPGNRGNRMDPNTPVGNTTLAKIERASIKAIMKKLATLEPELFEDALREGLLAPPPRSFPYLALAAAYLDGKPADATTTRELNDSRHIDLSTLTQEQLRERALQLAARLEPRRLAPTVIDAEVIRKEEVK